MVALCYIRRLNPGAPGEHLGIQFLWAIAILETYLPSQGVHLFFPV